MPNYQYENEQIFEKYEAVKLKEKVIRHLDHYAPSGNSSVPTLPRFETENNHQTILEAFAYYF